MKRITLYTLLAAMTLGAPLFTACDSDRDDNPILRTDATTFTVDELGTSPYVLTAEGDNQLTLSCTQPDYGFPAAVTYSVDICLNDRFEEGKTQALGEYKGHSFTLKNKDLNAAVVKLWQAENEGDYAGKDATVYFRVKARLSANNSGETTGNLVHATVRMFAIPVTVELPEAMYLVGADIGTAWSTWQPLVAVTGLPGEFWGMFYFSEGGEFKFGKFEGDWTGYGAIKSLKDEADAGVTGSDNIKVGKAGWYIVCITAKANATGDNLD
uniref:SusF/SusE family outer membrane protein n=1 Tax=Phocaeicola sp. TaxID=2773926 RepID=UPI003FEFD3D2